MVSESEVRDAVDAIDGIAEEAVIAALIGRFRTLKGTPMAALAYAVSAGLLKESLYWLQNVKPKLESAD
jgi:hypothetical protein